MYATKTMRRCEKSNRIYWTELAQIYLVCARAAERDGDETWKARNLANFRKALFHRRQKTGLPAA